MIKSRRILPTRLAHRLMLVTAGCAIVLGLLVLLGWYTYHVHLLQMTPTSAPMQYSAALGLLLWGGGCLALVGGCGMLMAVRLTAVGHLAYSAPAGVRPVASAHRELQREIAERQRAEEQLQRQQEALLQREKLATMGSLLASVAHELNNPLAIIMVQSDLLREEAGTGPLAERAAKITQAAERSVHIVQRFFTLARQRAPERTCVELNDVVAAAVELLAYALHVDSIEVDCHLAADLPMLWADPHQLQQVVVNLLSNAHQAMQATATPRRLTISTAADATRRRVQLTIADTGPGIPHDLQQRIFEPFFTTKPSGLGTGLGLSLCQGIVENHGGTIHVESVPGQGAVFRIELPVAAAPMAVLA